MGFRMRGGQMDFGFNPNKDVDKTAFHKRLLNSFYKKGGK
jgi:hypothetical protein